MELVDTEYFVILGGSIRMAAPVIGLILAFLASRRFDFAGSRLSIGGFVALALSQAFQLAVRHSSLRDSFLVTRERASDITIAWIITATLSTAGMVMLVLALRKLVAVAGSSTPRFGREDEH